MNPPSRRRPKHILFVDDLAVRLSSLTEWLRTEFEVTVATDVKHALDCLRSKAVDLVILDIQLPPPTMHEGISDELASLYTKKRRWGVWLLREMNRLDPTMQIIILTVVDQRRFDGDLSELGMDSKELRFSAYIMKPSSLAELDAAVKRALGEKAEV